MVLHIVLIAHSRVAGLCHANALVCLCLFVCLFVTVFYCRKMVAAIFTKLIIDRIVLVNTEACLLLFLLCKISREFYGK